MCFISLSKELLVAEQDITVYKLFKGEGKLNTLHRDFPYVEEELFTTKIKESESSVVLPSSEEESLFLMNNYPYHKIDWLLHGYVIETLPGLIVLSEGIHSFETLERAEYIRVYQNLEPIYRVSVRRCVIPAGSVYTKNQFGSVVSNQVIIKEIVNTQLSKQD